MPPRAGGTFSLLSRSTTTALTVAVLVTLVVGGLAVAPSAHGAAGAVGAPRPLVSPAAASPSAGPTHGDLVVGAGQTFTIQPLLPSTTYFQGGNITVNAGGTLVIKGVTLSFVQFVTPSGTAEARLSHIYHFVDDGTVLVTNSVITTNVVGVNVYPKLSLTVHGNMTLWNSVISFPGWVSVSGAGSSLTLNASKIERNPSVANLSEWSLLRNDSNYAPDISVSAGGALNLFGSNVTNLYSDNFAANGIPGPAPLTATNVFVGPQNLSGFSTPNDSANLTRDWLYYDGVAGGEVAFSFNNSLGTPSSAQITVWYGGVSYPLGTVTFPANTANGFTSIAFTPALTTAINSGGLLTYLNYTGDFGVGPSKISVQFSSVVGTPVNASVVSFILNPPVSNDLVVMGVGSQLSTVDSSIDLNFNDTPSSPISMKQPYPWLSNKLVVTGGANAYLANITLQNPILHVFNSSAILADSTSHAYLYRWAVFPIAGRGGVLPVQGATVRAYYAYDNNTTNNATATRLNNLASADPAIWDYVQFWDASHGFPAYATSGSAGTAAILLVANDITSTSLPDGQFLGGYHVFIHVPTPSANTQQFNWSVSTYPIGAAVGTLRYGLPDTASPSVFNSYFAGLSIDSVYAQVGGSNVSSVRYGQILQMKVTVRDTGTAPITTLLGELWYNMSFGQLLDPEQMNVSLTAPNQTTHFTLSWLVNDSVTGLHGAFDNNFTVVVQWNFGLPSLGGGSTILTNSTRILPSTVTLTGFAPFAPPTTLSANTPYATVGRVTYNGTEAATLELIAISSGGSKILLAFAHYGPGVPNGNYSSVVLDWNSASLSAGVSYTLQVSAVYNSVNQTYNFTGSFEIPSSAPSNILQEKFFGLFLWEWLAIAAAIVAGVLAFLFLSRRQAAGKLVECGECGNLIPDDARVCPKCGAEFESDVVRCSRCASTIPADSKFCPECAAQLLGKPEEAAADPDRKAYTEFTERFRAEAKKELGENYTEGAFWDWWKRQPTYTPFSQWKLQQSQGAPRQGMAAPPAAGGSSSDYLPTPPRRPPSGGTGGATASTSGKPGSQGGKPGEAPAQAAGTMKPCPSCSREIPSEYLVCPFCGSVTQ